MLRIGMNATRKLPIDGCRQRWRRTAIAAFAAGALALIPAASAPAAGTANLNMAIDVAVRSLTVSPGSINECDSPLTFPNDLCPHLENLAAQITITNGGAGGHVDVNGTNAVPSDGSGNDWLLCQAIGPVGCAGGGLPGADQFSQQTCGTFSSGPVSGSSCSTYVTAGPECDTAFEWSATSGSVAGCASTAGQTATEFLDLRGPSSSSDQSPVFTTTVTWTAVP
jgi:hypothetical protein